MTATVPKCSSLWDPLDRWATHGMLEEAEGTGEEEVEAVGDATEGGGGGAKEGRGGGAEGVRDAAEGGGRGAEEEGEDGLPERGISKGKGEHTDRIDQIEISALQSNRVGPIRSFLSKIREAPARRAVLAVVTFIGALGFFYVFLDPASRNEIFEETTSSCDSKSSAAGEPTGSKTETSGSTTREDNVSQFRTVCRSF